MRVSVFGLGYVGCVNLVCLRHSGHTVIGVDVVADKVESINGGSVPIWEPGLDELLQSSSTAPPPIATADHTRAVAETDLSVVCVGTPATASGAQDLRYVERVLSQIVGAARKLAKQHTVVLRSSVAPGSHARVLLPLLERQGSGTDVDYAYYPEFLREGQALDDYAAPSVNVFAARSERTESTLRELFATPDAPLLEVAFGEAEMLKYASNGFHALKVAFANEIGAISRSLDIDAAAVMQIFARDRKLNVSKAYLRPGFAFGGSCLPKDTRSLVQVAGQHNVDIPLLRSILPSNESHILRLIAEIERHEPRVVGFWGVSFKPDTDDMRESPIIEVMEALMSPATRYKASMRVLAHDAAAVLAKLEDRYSDAVGIPDSANALVAESDVLILGTRPVTDDLRDALSAQATRIIDLRYFDVPREISQHPGYTAFA